MGDQRAGLDQEYTGKLIKDRSTTGVLTAPTRTFHFLLLKQLTRSSTVLFK